MATEQVYSDCNALCCIRKASGSNVDHERMFLVFPILSRHVLD